MSSGITVDEACLTEYRLLQRKINGVKHKYIIFKVSDDRTKIEVEKTSDEEDYELFVNALPATECRWVTYDFNYDLGDAGKRSKIVFISWSPDTAKIREKMVFASSTDALRRALGVAAVIQATDTSEVEYETILEKVKKT